MEPTPALLHVRGNIPNEFANENFLTHIPVFLDLSGACESDEIMPKKLPPAAALLLWTIIFILWFFVYQHMRHNDCVPYIKELYTYVE